MSIEETLIRAEMVVNDYAENETRKAIDRIEKLRTHKAKCQCLSCATSAVRDVNDWVKWHAAANPKLREYQDALLYKIVKKKKGGFEIVTNDYER